MPLITTELIAGSLYSYFHNRSWDTLFASVDHFKQALKRAIDRSLDRYKAERPYTGTDGRIPFYDSQAVIDELLKYRVMHAGEYDVAQMLNVLSADPRLLPPDQADIDAFYAIFMEEVRTDEQLRQLEIKATFTTEIFQISAKIDRLQRSFDQLSKVFNADLEMQWKSRSDAYLELMRQYKFASALMLLEAFERSFADSEKEPPARILAAIAYQKALCFQFLGRIDELRRSYIRAYQLAPERKPYKQRAALAFLKLGDLPKARQLSAELLAADEYDHMAWAITVIAAGPEELPAVLETVPVPVKKDLGFLAVAVNSANVGHKHQLLELFFEQGLVPPVSEFSGAPLALDNYLEYIFWIDTSINRLFHRFFCNFRVVDGGDPGILAFLDQLLASFLARTDASEIPEKNGLLHFMQAYTRYSLAPDIREARAMAACYPSIEHKDDLFIILAANALQLAGEPSEALELLAQVQEETLVSHLLRGVCALALRNKAGFVASTRAWLTDLQEVSGSLTANYIETLIQLKYFNELSQFTAADFLQGKTFERDGDAQLVALLVCALFEGSTPEGRETLRQLAAERPEEEVRRMIGMICYFTGDYELCLEVLRRDLDSTRESQALLFYIYALFQSKKDQKELLDLAAYWRQHFSFNADFVRLEMQLRRDRLEWTKCVAAGERYLAEQPDDEFVLALYAFALQEEGSAASLEKLQEIAPKLAAFDFQTPTFAGQVAQILIRNQLFADGLKLLYRYAREPELTELKLPYFMAVAACAGHPGADGLIQEKEEVTAGDFVKYTMNGQVHFVELTPAKLKVPFFREFIGCRKGGAFTHARLISGETDLVSIDRIMNKYLALHDQILEEVRQNPHSGIPMESLDYTGPEGMIERFQQMFGAQGNAHKDLYQHDLALYEGLEKSLTEMAFAYHEGNYLAAYYQLALKDSGIRTLPQTLFSPAAGGYVLDYSSLALLYQQYRMHGVVYPEPFVLSAFIVDHLKKELAAQQGQGPELSFSVRTDMFIPLGDGSAERENNVVYLQGMLDWIAAHCQVIVSDRLHDFLRNLERHDPQDRGFIDYALNTTLLVEDGPGRKLVTDDLAYLRFGLLGLDRLASTETFVKAHLGEAHPALLEFLRNGYHSYAVSEDQLNEEWHKKLSGQFHVYDRALVDLSLMLNPAATLPAIRHAKHIALHYLGEPAALQLSLRAIFSTLIGTNPAPQALAGIQALIKLECYLMGQKLDTILEAFQEAARDRS